MSALREDTATTNPFPAFCRRLGVALAVGLLNVAAHADMGFAEIPATAQDGTVTLFYPSSGAAERIDRGSDMSFDAAAQGVPIRGNARLVVISHGSGGSPWVFTNLARALVGAGFVVALPEHHADNYKDDRGPGPDSWALRPAEVSRAIDAVGRDPRFAPLLQLDRVGVYGMSAGGHTALSLAGGVWSPGNFKRHCQAHLVEDFQACVGLATRLTGGPLDGLKEWVALAVIDWRFDDDTPRRAHDPRVAAVVAGVPFAADFDMSSLAAPPLPVGLITAGQDRWLVPRFHSDRVLQACKSCELIAALPDGGHGALLSPLPAGMGGLLGNMLNDPPGFDRDVMRDVDRRIVAFFRRHLLVGKGF